MFESAKAYRDLAVLNLAIHAVLQWSDCTDQIVSYPLHRDRYSLILNLGLRWSCLPSDVHQAALLLFILGVENIPLSKSIVVWVYINIGMIASVKTIPGAKIAGLGMKCNLLKSHPFLMFQQAVAWLFSPHCRARCLFLLSEEIKADHSAQGAAWALGTHGCHKIMLYKEKRSDAEEEGNTGEKEAASQGLEEGVLSFLCRPQRSRSEVADKMRELGWKPALLLLAEVTQVKKHV